MDNNNKFKVNFNYDDESIYSDNYKDISSHSYEDISSNSFKQDISSHSVKSQPKKKKRKKKSRKLITAISIFLAVILVCSVGFYSYAYNLIDDMPRASLDQNNLGITTSNYKDVINIALLGLDSRQDNNSGRADANVVVTVDKKHKKIKLTSIARDTYVSIDGNRKDKLTHAYAYGKSELSVKTINQNFGLEITDYVTINFFGLARVIDYIGGVTLDVDQKEFDELNGYVFPTTDFGDISCEYLTEPGIQLLSGAQAVCYARIRHTDSDVERGNRQKEVIMAIFAAVKKMNPLKLPKFASMLLSECETSLKTADIMNLGLWTVLTTPEFEQLSIPNENIPASGRTIRGVWYYVYDIEKAKTEIKDFIFEQNYYSPEAVEKRKTETEKS